ncbi:MAG: RNA polymerase sigma factor [Tannerellaceae bacterium]|jgi:RNA polymerase sigma-70 factor (ECF subfamily)|nr:RNA polymerase sigma factor [Tannerellaceae bacterium]
MTAERFKHDFLPLHPKLFRLAFALTENRRNAEDILQDAYLKLWNMRNKLDGINNPEAFCVTMVKNMCISSLRASRRHEGIELAQMMPDATDSPEAKAATKNSIDIVSTLIERLPENQRKVLRLYGIKDCTMEEIEQITGFSAGNIRVLLSRARKFIKEQYLKNYE